MTGYKINFNQDFTSISVLSKTGFRLFSINSNDKIDEIFSKDSEHIRIVERLFNSSLVVLVTVEKPNCLKMLHFKKKQDICNCVYPSEILSVRMNRNRLVVCLAESIHIHDIRDMKILHSIENIAPNELGLCSLSLNSHLAFPISSTSGELRVFNANKLRSAITIRAHESTLSALCFSPSGTLIATASEKGTVIRVFCVKNGQRVQEFRRGVKRCVRIASLVFSSTGDFLCASSNTETVHIFKIDMKAVEVAESKPMINREENPKATATKTTPATKPTITEGDERTAIVQNKIEESTASSGVMGYLTKAMSSYLIPTQVSDVLSQDRAFAMTIMPSAGLRHVCALTCIQKELKLLVACEDGFLYIHEFNVERGGPCKLQSVHDLRYALEGVTELYLTDSMDKLSLPCTPTKSTSAANVPTPTALSALTAGRDVGKSCAASVIIENPDPAPDNSYAGILKGNQMATTLSDSAKFRKLCDAIDTPTKLFDERQFPPVAIAAKD